MNKALIDTDILLVMIKGVDMTVARHATAYRQTFGRYTLAAISVMEIVRGFRRVQSPRRIAAFLRNFSGEEILAFDSPAGKLAGEIAGDLERTGQPISFADPMLAAIALTNGLEVVTGNTAHFQRIQKLSHPLVLADWRF